MRAKAGARIWSGLFRAPAFSGIAGAPFGRVSAGSLKRRATACDTFRCDVTASHRARVVLIDDNAAADGTLSRRNVSNEGSTRSPLSPPTRPVPHLAPTS